MNAQTSDSEMKRKQWEKDLQTVCDTEAGRRFVSAILAYSGVMLNPFRQGDSDATSFNCGRREPAQWLYQQIKTVCPAHAAGLDL